jgi:hypothetical protein
MDTLFRVCVANRELFFQDCWGLDVKCGVIDDARQLFDKMPERDVEFEIAKKLKAPKATEGDRLSDLPSPFCKLQ